MNRQDSVKLIDQAKKVTGSDYRTAQLIDAKRTNVSNWRYGKPIPPGDVALLAQIAGLDPEAWALRAVAEHYDKSTTKGEKVRNALKKALAVTGAAIISSGATASDLGHEAAHYFIRCIKSQISPYHGPERRRSNLQSNVA